MVQTRRRPAREKILAAAAELFYADGIGATGIDAVIEHAGVARKSLYNNFASKDDLVAAFLDRRHSTWLDFLHARLAQTPAADATAVTRVLAVVDAYRDHAASDGERFRGCGLLNTAAEFPAGSAAREAVRAHKEEVEKILADALTGSTGSTVGTGTATTAEAGVLAAHLSFLLEGAVTRAGLDGTTTHLDHARTMAEHLVTTATATTTGTHA